jgi:hypothetical protein
MASIACMQKRPRGAHLKLLLVLTLMHVPIPSFDKNSSSNSNLLFPRRSNHKYVVAVALWPINHMNASPTKHHRPPQINHINTSDMYS